MTQANGNKEIAQQVNPAAQIAVASLVKLVSLLSAEMVVGKYRDDIDILENAVRRKCFATIPGASAEATAEGVAAAHRLLDPVFRDLRARAALLAQESQPAARTPQQAVPRARLH
jgi:hypothetical protein